MDSFALVFHYIEQYYRVRVNAQASFASHSNTQHHNKRSLLKYSNDEEDPPEAVNISKFQLDLLGTFPASLTASALGPLVEAFLTSYIGTVFSSQNMTLDGLYLAAPSSRRRQLRTSTRNVQETTLSVIIDGGVAYFLDEAYPNETTLQDAIEYGLEEDFPDLSRGYRQ